MIQIDTAGAILGSYVEFNNTTVSFARYVINHQPLPVC